MIQSCIVELYKWRPSTISTKKYTSVLVSNRLPVTVKKINGKLHYETSNGGLTRAMMSLDKTNRIWIGWPGINSDELTATDKSDIKRELEKQGCYPLFLSADEVEKYYEGYSNDTLWPLFHYFQSLTQNNEEYWEVYKNVNRRFAEATIKFAEDKATIWVHDYQLLLVPSMLRKKLSRATIGFFLHIPFPSYELFRQLPNRQEIMDGMLGSDLLGFHTYDYARHFLSSARRIVAAENHRGVIHYDDRKMLGDSFPIGIDYKKYVSTIASKSVVINAESIKDHHINQKIIVSIDRLDYTKGIMQRLEAYELFLKEHAEFHEKIVLIMVAVPSRMEVETYKDLRDEIEKTVSRINGQYSGVNWSPISYQFKNLPFEEVLSLYASAEIALVTPLRDGMNLVAKEFVAAKQDGNGVLVLSEMAGAIEELPEAIAVNPNSIRSIKDGLLEALNMGLPERQQRMKKMQERLKDYDVLTWASDFMEQLLEVHASKTISEEKRITTELRNNIALSFKRSKKRLILLAYDGTLQSFVGSEKAKDATPSKQTMQLIKRLSEQDNTTVCIISGRTKAHLLSWFNGLDILLVAEYGAWIREGDEWRESYSSFNDKRQEILEIMYKYAKRTTGAIVEEKSHSVVWHYRVVKSELAYARNANLKEELDRLLQDTGLKAYKGNKIVDVRPEHIQKGVVARELYDSLDPDFVMSIGDDIADEDVFARLPDEAFTVKVGEGETEAMFSVKNVDEVITLLDSLVD